MFRAIFTQRVFVVGLLTALLAGGHAFADDDDRGRGDSGGGGRSSGGRDGGGGGSDRSRSGGGDSSSRSMSSRSGGSSRSFSGGDSSRGRGESAIRSGGESSRSGGESSRSYSGGSSRSFSEGSRSSSPAMRSLESQGSISRTPQGSAGMRSNRESGESGSALRSFQRNPSGQSATEGSTPRDFNRSSGDSSQYSRSFGNPNSGPGTDSNNATTTDSSRAGRSLQRNDSNRSIGELNRSRGQSGDSRSLNSREYTAGRPTNDQVQDFLKLRREGEANQSGGLNNQNNQASNAELGARRTGGNFSRGDGNRNTTDGVSGNARPENLRNRVNESQNQGDSAWARRFGGDNNRGDSDRGDENRGDNNRGDQTARTGNEGPRDGNFSRRQGDTNRPNEGRGDNDRNLSGDRNGRDGRNDRDFDDDDRKRDFGDRKFVDNKYQDWRKDAWRGERGEGRDHRDWSGRWKDGDRFVAANRIRDHWDGDHDRDDLPFRGGWWKNHHGHGGHWDHWDHHSHHHHHPYYWWTWGSAPRLTSWVSFGWNRPYYWDYGPGEYIYCYDNVIYVNGRWFQPAPIYYENTVVLAQRAPDFTPEQAQQLEWMPLGVFAVARDGVPDKNVLVQLAVTKDGVMGGTVFNQTTGASFAVEGTVDKETQRAVWTYTDETNARIVMETSVYNLTQPEATGLIHYGPDDIQVMELVRLEQPDAGAAPAATATGELPAP